jgi:hypothetical protein
MLNNKIVFTYSFRDSATPTPLMLVDKNKSIFLPGDKIEYKTGPVIPV